MVSHTNAVIDPRAVVVPTFNTTITNAAVLRARCGQDFAARADVIWVEVLQQVVKFILMLEVAWVLATGK